MAIPQMMSGLHAPQQCISRRTLLKSSAAMTVAMGMAARTTAEQPVPGASSGPLRAGKVLDCHAHLTHHGRPTWEADDRKLIDAADKLGIDQLCCSTLTPRWPATLDGFRECNQWTADGMRRFPGRVLGYCYVNPGYGREALEEIRRYTGDYGFIGISQNWPAPTPKRCSSALTSPAGAIGNGPSRLCATHRTSSSTPAVASRTPTRWTWRRRLSAWIGSCSVATRP